MKLAAVIPAKDAACHPDLSAAKGKVPLWLTDKVR
jgi:hypothetical protein